MRDRAAIAAYLTPSDGTESRGMSFSTIGRFVRRTMTYPGQLVLSVTCMALASAATIAAPRICGAIIDNALIPKDTHALRWYVLLFCAVEIVRLIATIGQGWLFGDLGQRVLHDIRVELLQRIVRLEMTVLDRVQSGQLMSRLIADATALGQVFTAGVVSIVERLIVVIGIVIALVLLNPTLALMTLGLFPVLFVVSYLLSKAIYTSTRTVRTTVGAVTSFLSECLAGRVVIEAFNGATVQERRFRVLSAALADAQKRPVLLNAVFHPGMTLINATTVALLIWIGGDMVASGRLELGVLVAFIFYVLWVFWPIMHIVNQWNVLLGGVAAAERVFEVLDWPVEQSDGDNVAEVEFRGAIRFEGVWFAYRGEEWVLKDVSFEVHPGERIALVGPTGCGKSTILALLFGFYTPQRGEIYLDGKLISEWPLATLRKKIGLVQQEGALFNGTVAENISIFGEYNLSAVAGAERCPIPLDRAVSEISAGERQWVAFLRTAARTPSVWILDEAASHLDPQLDSELHALVERERNGGTVIVVAHRLSSIRDMQRIIVLYQGRVVEMGTHGSLMSKAGLYAHLLELQDSTANR